MGGQTCPAAKRRRYNNRINKLFFTLNKDKWTSKSPESNSVPLNIRWMIDDVPNNSLPEYITQDFNHSL